MIAPSGSQQILDQQIFVLLTQFSSSPNSFQESELYFLDITYITKYRLQLKYSRIEYVSNYTKGNICCVKKGSSYVVIVHLEWLQLSHSFCQSPQNC